jgi:hypothetical protein
MNCRDTVFWITLSGRTDHVQLGLLQSASQYAMTFMSNVTRTEFGHQNNYEENRKGTLDNFSGVYQLLALP